MIDALTNGLMHHAYLLEGDIEPSYEALLKSLTALQISTLGNPDLFIKEYENLLIDDVREIKDFESESAAVPNARKILILKTRMFSYPAQNALLKVFEEPRPGVVIFLIMPDATKLFPTLRSRLFAVMGKFAADDELRAEAKTFLRLAKGERLAFVKKFTDMESKPLLKEKTVKFLGFLEKEIAGSTDPATSLGASKKKAEDIYLAKQFVGDQGSSPKILLEHLAVTL